MMNHLFSVAVLASVMVAGTSAFAAKEAPHARHDGKFVSMTDNQFVMTLKKGRKEAKEMTHTLATDAKVMLDGKSCELSDLKAGMKIRVSTDANDANQATMVEAIDKNKLFAHTHDGKVVSITSSKLTMTDKLGKEHSHTISPETNVCCDGVECSSSELKAGMLIRVTTQADDVGVAVGIEALDKDSEFVGL